MAAVREHHCGTACGDDPTGVDGCGDPQAVWVEFTDSGGAEMAAVLCHRHAAGLRAGDDIWDETGWYFDAQPYTVTLWRASR